MGILQRGAAMLSAASLLGACAAPSTSLSVNDAELGSPNLAYPSFQANGANLNSSTLRAAGAVVPTTAYPVEIGPLAPGEYVAEYATNFQRLFSGQVETQRATASFRVREPSGCFSFNRPSGGVPFAWNNLQGWSAGGYYVAGTSTPASQTCSPSYHVADTYGSESPDPADGNGGVRLFIYANCLRTPAVNNNQWHTDFSSPDLSAYPKWQGISGFSFAIRTSRMSGVNPQVQSIVTVRKADGTVATIAEGTQANRVFHPVTGTYQTISSPISIPAGATVMGARVRIFGTLPLMPPDFEIDVDNFCPVP
jgi:hypothetical protein